MIDAQTYSLFLITAVVLVLTPGPDTVLVLSRTVASGPAAGFATLLGTQTGNVIHAILAGIGLSTLILLVPFAFEALKVAGVLYLLYLAIVTWRAPATLDLRPSLDTRFDFSRLFVQGLGNNLTNPKAVAFFLALFPQFIRPEHGSLAIQSFALGSTLALVAVAWIGLLVVAVGRVRSAVARSAAVLRVANRLAAVTFVGLACRLALEERR